VKISAELRDTIQQEVEKSLEIASTTGASTHTPNFSEIGTTGLRRFGGYVYEEFLPQLRWPRASKIYQEMESNDPVIGAILYVCEQLIRRASWRIEAGGSKPIDKEAKEFLESCMGDMSTTWVDTIAEVLTMLPYGFAWHEVVYKRRQGDVRDPRRRSKYDDNRIGWRRLPGRAQHTIKEWIFDEVDDGGVVAAIQQAPPDHNKRVIPLEKSLLFRTKANYNNPEGRSLLRNAYRCFSKDTEILTSRGWIPGLDLTMDDEICTLNAGTHQVEYQKPIKLNVYDHDGEMYTCNSRSVSMCVTGNHRCYVKQSRSGKFTFLTPDNIKYYHKAIGFGKWHGTPMGYYTIPPFTSRIGQTFKGFRVPIDTWLAICACVIAEGGTSRGAVRQETYITQGKEETADKIRDLLESSGIPYTEFDNGNVKKFAFSQRNIYDEFVDMGTSGTKYIPDFIKQLPPENIRTFLDWYVMCDGSIVGNLEDYKGTKVIYSTSKRLIDDLQELALKAGYYGQIRIAQRKATSGRIINGIATGLNNDLWQMSLGKPNARAFGNIEKTPYKGKVWCPTTENGIVYVRRNGKPHFSGNSWYFKKHIEEIEGIGIERDLAGLPVLTPPDTVDIWNPHDELATRMRNEGEKLVRNIRRDQSEGVLLPFGWKLELLSTGSRRQFDTNAIINRYDQRIAITLLADIVMMGGDKVGSFALADVKSSLLGAALEAILESIAEIFNRHAIPRLFKLNAFPGLTDYPKLITGEVLVPNLSEMARYIQALSGAQMPLFPDENLEDFLRNIAGMPMKPAETLDAPAPQPGATLPGTPDVDGRLMNTGAPQGVR